jgi:hypothetical protein
MLSMLNSFQLLYRSSILVVRYAMDFELIVSKVCNERSSATPHVPSLALVRPHGSLRRTRNFLKPCPCKARWCSLRENESSYDDATTRMLNTDPHTYQFTRFHQFSTYSGRRFWYLR